MPEADGVEDVAVSACFNNFAAATASADAWIHGVPLRPRMWAMKADFSPLVDPVDAQALNKFSEIQIAEILYSHLRQSKFFPSLLLLRRLIRHHWMGPAIWPGSHNAEHSLYSMFCSGSCFACHHGGKMAREG